MNSIEYSQYTSAWLNHRPFPHIQLFVIGIQGSCPGELSPSGNSSQNDMRSFYQLEMEAMLPLHSNQGNGVDNVPMGVGHISRELQLQLPPSQPQPEVVQEMPRWDPRRWISRKE